MMTKTMQFATGALVTLGIALAASFPAQAASDAFNRSKLGGTWVVTSPKISISADQLVGSDLGLAYLKAASTTNAASAVIYANGTGLQYGAVVVGNIAGGSDAFVKIQEQNGGGTFDHAAFYNGNNGSGSFFALSTPVPSPATIDVAFTGTVATLRITSAAGVQTYTYDYGTTVGNGGGLGTYGASSLDNFVTYTGTSSTLAIAGVDAVRVTAGANTERDLSK